MIKSINTWLSKLKKSFPQDQFQKGKTLFEEARCQVLSQSAESVDLLVDNEEEELDITIEEAENSLRYVHIPVLKT